MSYLQIILVSLFFYLSACSSHPTLPEVTAPTPPKTEGALIGIETQQLAAEQEADFATELSFRKNKTGLSIANKKHLKDFFKNFKKPAQAYTIKIITWGDQDYPSDEIDELSSKQKKLAADRSEAIKNYFARENLAASYETYNMTERPTTFEKILGNGDARVKASLEHAGIPATGTTSAYRSKASKAILIVTTERE